MSSSSNIILPAILASIFLALMVVLHASAFAAEQQDASAQGQTVQPSCADAGDGGGQTQKQVESPACAEPEREICSGADASFFSKYVSRGVDMTDGPVFEPDAWISYRHFTATVWANVDLTDKNHKDGKFTEFDFTLDYSASIGKLGLSAGAIYYDYVSAPNTAEVYGSVNYDTFLSPKLVVYYDCWQADGFYGVLSMGHTFCLPRPAKWLNPSLSLSGQVGWGSSNFNSYSWGANHSTFTDAVFTAGLPTRISSRLSLTPTVSYSTVLDRTIRTKNHKNDNIIWGAVVSANL